MISLNRLKHLLSFGVLIVVSAEDVPTGVEPVPAQPVTIQQILVNLILYILEFSAALAVLFIIIGGVRYIVSAGDEDAAEKAKRMILYAIIGLIIIILSFVIVNFIQTSFVPIIVP